MFLMNAAYLIVGALWPLIIVRFISGVAMGVIGTATGTFVATIVPRHLHGRGIAYYSMSTALALCFGPFISIALLGTIGYTGIFTIATTLSGISLLLMYFVIDARLNWIVPSPKRALPWTTSLIVVLCPLVSGWVLFVSVGEMFRRCWPDTLKSMTLLPLLPFSSCFMLLQP